MNFKSLNACVVGLIVSKIMVIGLVISTVLFLIAQGTVPCGTLAVVITWLTWKNKHFFDVSVEVPVESEGEEIEQH